MKKIVQLDEYEYNKIYELAKLNESQIEERALKLYKDKGVAEVEIDVKIGRDKEYSYTRRFNCTAFIWHKDGKFSIPEKLRNRLGKLIKEQVLREVSEKYGEPLYLLNRYSKEKHDLQMARYILWTIAVSGWAAFVACLCKILN